MNTDQILKKFNLEYEDLNAVEKETLHSWVEALGKNKLTLTDVKRFIASMKEAVEKDLCVADLDSKKDLLLKARLRNYMLLEAFLSTPERAKEALERTMSGVVGVKK